MHTYIYNVDIRTMCVHIFMSSMSDAYLSVKYVSVDLGKVGRH